MKAVTASSSKKATLLMLTQRVPFPPDRGDRIRSNRILQYLAKDYRVSLGCLTDAPLSTAQQQFITSHVERFCAETIWPLSAKLRAVLALITGKAFTPSYFFSAALHRTVVNWHRTHDFDVILTYCSSMTQYASAVLEHDRRSHKASPRPIHVIDLVDVDSDKWRDYAGRCRGPMRLAYRSESKRLRRIERGELEPFDAVTLVSSTEAELYERVVGPQDGLFVTRQAVDTVKLKPLPDPDNHRMLFIGVLDYEPNIDAMEWFVYEVLPQLRATISDANLQIVGQSPHRRVLNLQRIDGVEVVGPVPEVGPYLAGASIIVAPLRIARGVQTKVLEGMASGRVVVCSPEALNGIEANPEEHLLMANGTHEWVSQLNRCLSDNQLRQRIGLAARRRIEEAYNWAECLRPLGETLERLVSARAARRKEA